LQGYLNPSIFSLTPALSSEVFQRAEVRMCTSINPKNCPTRAKKFGLPVRFRGQMSRNCCWLFVPNDEAPSESGLPTAAPVLVSTSHFTLRWLFHNRIRMPTPFTPDADVPVNHYYSPDPPNSGIGYISHSIFVFDSSIYSDNCL
jgi:hypothetical protein